MITRYLIIWPNQLELSQKMNNIDVYYKNILDVYVKTVGEKI